MQFKTLIAGLAGLAGTIALPAHADTFDGPYVGVQAGWNRGEVADAATETLPLDAEASRDALVIGGYAGYNHRIGENFVIGAEAGFSGAVDDEIRAQSDGNAVTLDPRYSFDLSARAGYLVTEETLVYLRGGYANTRVRTALEGEDDILRSSDNLDGWSVGGGIERAITDRISARVEYRYSDLGTDDGRWDRHQVLVGVSYNF
jgi:outer membrane immunogenic protein